MTRYTEMKSPIGVLTFVKAPETNALGALYIEQTLPPKQTGWKRDAAAFTVETRQLAEYFAGERDTFDFDLAPEGTRFQQAVWRALRAIPFGHTTSYGALARSIGRPSASRAVGAANGKNPIAIVVPCHRVIGSTGALVGYAGGIRCKQWLLAHESHLRRYTLMIGTPSCAST